MGDSYRDSKRGQNFNGMRENARSDFRGQRGPNNRDKGGFRIRLSDNEMNAAKRIQDAFNLRSTVAVLGFALRTLGQMLEDGKLDALKDEFSSQGHGNIRDHREIESTKRLANTKPNPFARPAKPQSNESIATNEEEILKSEKLEIENGSEDQDQGTKTATENNSNEN